MNIFQISPNDQSIYYLGRIFGNVGNVLPGTGPALLGDMFRVFNTALLVLASFIIVYTVIVGLINTASQGEFLGKKWNGLWTIFRIVFGVLGLFPLPGSGYCLIQVLAMWIIMQGVGAADSLWSATVDYLAKGGAVQTPVPSFSSSNTDKIQNVYQALVCQAAIEKYYCPKATETGDREWCAQSHDFNVKAEGTGKTQLRYNIGRGGVCGHILLTNPNPEKKEAKSELKYKIAAAQLQAYQAIVPVFQKVARYSVNSVAAYTTFFDSFSEASEASRPDWLPTEGFETKSELPQPACSATKGCEQLAKMFATYSPLGGSNFIRDSANLYEGYVSNVTTQSSPEDAAKAAEFKVTLQKSKVNGWIFAGGYYYAIASMNNTIMDSSSSTIEAYSLEPDQQSTYLANIGKEDFPKILNAYHINTAILKAIRAEQALGGGEGTFNAGVASEGTEKVSGIARDVVKFWMKTLTASGGGDTQTQVNPLISLQTFGKYTLSIIQIAFIAIWISGMVAIGVSSTCAAMNGFGYGVNWGWTFFMIPLFGFMGAMFVFASMLAVYFPMIPYILFTFGAIGWMIATIETMIASPIIAIGIMFPEGGHEIWGRAGPAGQILLNLFLRPSLMIFGMMTGMLLSYVVVTFINAAFLGVMKQIGVGHGGGSPGIVETFLFMAIYTTMLMAALNKCFSLIHVVPDQILRFIGAGREQFGEGGLEETKKAGEAAAGTAKGTGEAAGGAAKDVGKARAQREEAAAGAAHKADMVAALKNNAGGGGKTPPKQGT